MNTEHEIELKMDGRMCVADVDVTWVKEDHGIGEYEFWGSVGIHEDIQWGLESVYVKEFTIYDERGDAVDVEVKHPENRSDPDIQTYVAIIADYIAGNPDILGEPEW